MWLKAGWRAQHEGLRWDRKEVSLVRVASRQAHDELKATDDDPAEGIASELTAHPVGLAAPTDWHDLLQHARRVPIEPERRADGTLRLFQPQNKYGGRHRVPLHRYGSGSFCRFKVPGHITKPGVYLIVADDTLAYVGECVDFSQRFNMGYGQISPRNCYAGGQETNCRVNQLILRCAQAERTVAVYFIETPHHKALEDALVKAYSPPWNR